MFLNVVEITELDDGGNRNGEYFPEEFGFLPPKVLEQRRAREREVEIE